MSMRRARSAYASDADDLATVAEGEEDAERSAGAAAFAEDERALLVART